MWDQNVAKVPVSVIPHTLSGSLFVINRTETIQFILLMPVLCIISSICGVYAIGAEPDKGGRRRLSPFLIWRVIGYGTNNGGLMRRQMFLSFASADAFFSHIPV
jgi:hypothetical protein